MSNDQSPLKDIHFQPTSQVIVPVTYRSEWNDGFGAQGWKLDCALDDRKVIACTSYSGGGSPTSVLVHDVLDHYISGFPLSGYDHEAMATAMHGLRNGIEVTSSFKWMVDEILNDPDLEDSLLPFLPPNMAGVILNEPLSGKAQRQRLLEHIDIEQLRESLLAGFFRVGLEGVPKAIQQWQAHGLGFANMRAIGFSLQRLLQRADAYVGEQNISYAKAQFGLSNEQCYLHIDTGASEDPHTMLEPVI